jgi:hypothetical protein
LIKKETEYEEGWAWGKISFHASPSESGAVRRPAAAFALGQKRCQIVSCSGKKVKKLSEERRSVAAENSKKTSQSWVDRLIKALQNLPGARKKSKVRQMPDPEDYAWKETEEEYQKAQAEWLQQVQSGRKQKKKE